MEYFVEIGARQRFDVGEPLHESFEVGDYGRNLGLLQHHLGDPYAIRRARLLPRQVLATMFVEPVEQAIGEPRHCSCAFGGGCCCAPLCRSSSSERAASRYWAGTFSSMA